MAVSVSNVLDVPYRIVGNEKETVYDVTFDSRYTRSGEALTASQLGLSYIEQSTATIKSVGGSVNVANVHFDEDNNLIHLYDETPAEVAEDADVSGIVARVTSRGN